MDQPIPVIELPRERELAGIRARLTRARRLYLALIAEDPASRGAWETLVGPVDWARAERGEAQSDEPFHDEPDLAEGADPGARADREAAPPYSFNNPDMLLTAERGLIADITGGPDPLDAMRRALLPPAADDDLSEEDQANIAAYRDALKEAGWEEDSDGTMWGPGERDSPADPSPANDA